MGAKQPLERGGDEEHTTLCIWWPPPAPVAACGWLVCPSVTNSAITAEAISITLTHARRPWGVEAADVEATVS